MKKKEIRFAVGQLGNQLSPIFKIWNSKNDVYISGKFMGGTFKISLHESGIWTVAATTESKLELRPGNRRMKAWKRPPEFKKGWTWGPHIAVPRLMTVDHLKFDEKQTKQIEWIPSPSKNMKATIGVVFASPELQLEDMKEICDKNDGYIDCYLELKNLQKVFIRVRYESLTQADHNHITYLQSEANKWIELNSDIRGCLTLFMKGAETPYVYVLKFGSS